MNVALVHDFLTQRGGAERVALQFARIFPQAPLYTSLYDPSATYPEFAEVNVKTTWMQGKIRPDKFRLAAPLYPWAFRSLRIPAVDRVVVSSSAFAHHIVHPKTYVYCHTPPRFLYDAAAYSRSEGLVSSTRRLFDGLRRWDFLAALRARSYAANSRATARRIENTYDIEARVIYPPLNLSHLPAELTSLPAEPRVLAVARLLPYKKLDLAIKACQHADVPLTLVGDGPDAARLRELAEGARVNMLGRVSDETLAELFATHSLVIAPGREDFGYAPIEANYAGRPVVARNDGGFVETVSHEVTGLLVDSEDPYEWGAAVKSALARSWDPEMLRETTVRYQQSAFRAAILDWLEMPSNLH